MTHFATRSCTLLHATVHHVKMYAQHTIACVTKRASRQNARTTYYCMCKCVHHVKMHAQHTIACVTKRASRQNARTAYYCM
jgi:hypothetical protein